MEMGHEDDRRAQPLGCPQAGPGGRPRTGPLLFDPLNDGEGLRRGTRVHLVIKQNFPQGERDTELALRVD